MAKKILGIDVDGVLADTMEHWLDFYRNEFDTVVSKEDLFLYDFSAILPFVDKEKMREYFVKAWIDWKNIEIRDKKAPKVISTLAKKYKISIVTSTWGSVDNVKKWLNKNKIYYDNFVFTKNADEKVKYCDILVDDSLSNIKNMYKHKKLGILYESPWNLKVLSEKKPPYIISASDWKEIGELLLGLSLIKW